LGNAKTNDQSGSFNNYNNSADCDNQGGENCSRATTSERPNSFDEIKAAILREQDLTLKFIKIKLSCPTTFKSKTVVRGYGDEDTFEAFINDELDNIPDANQLSITCTGGGTIRQANIGG